MHCFQAIGLRAIGRQAIARRGLGIGLLLLAIGCRAPPPFELDPAADLAGQSDDADSKPRFGADSGSLLDIAPASTADTASGKDLDGAASPQPDVAGEAAGQDGAGDGAAAGDAAADADAGAPEAGPPFGVCPVGYQVGYKVSCASFAVQLEPLTAWPTTIDVLAIRVDEAKPTLPGKFWMLQGGPGGSAAGLISYAAMLQAWGFPYAIYLLEHRGVGASTRLSCTKGGWVPDPVAEAADPLACIAELKTTWGSALKQFSSVGAAHDLAAVTAAMRQGDEPIFVYGVSYGTFWLQRFLWLYPDGASAVIFDSSCPIGVCSSLGYSTSHNDALLAVLSGCDSDPSCASHFSLSTVALAKALLMPPAPTLCAALDTPSLGPLALRFALSWMTRSEWSRTLIPPTLARIARCNPKDVAELQTFVGQLSALSSFAPAAPLKSLMLYYNVALSEMTTATAAQWADAIALEDKQLAFTGSLASISAFQQKWPTFPSDFGDGVAKIDHPPMLVLQGGLDPQTGPALGAAMHAAFSQPANTLAVAPFSSHGVLSEPNVNASGDLCVVAMLKQFLAQPLSKLDASCFGSKLDLQVDPMLADYFFGTTDVWGDGNPTPGNPVLDPEFAKRIERLKWHLGGQPSSAPP